jgi:branched-chain amino acid transport system ATP-binding protein
VTNLDVPLLRVESLSVYYGRVNAVAEVSLVVRSGQVVALLGANGAGKSTTVRSICGAIKPSGGTVEFDGATINKWPGYHRAREGLFLVPEGRKIISKLSVEDNLLLGGYRLGGRKKLRDSLIEMYELFPILSERRLVAGGLLSGGEQQMLAIARALMGRPKLLMLDEPTLGLAPIMVEAVMAKIEAISATGIAILMVEQNAAAALPRSDYVYLLEQGKVVYSGDAEASLTDGAIADAFLGSASVTTAPTS